MLLVLGLEAVHAQVNVGAVEPLHEHPRTAHAEPRDDFITHLRRGGGGQGKHARMPQRFDHMPEVQVIGAKVMAPLADAVSLDLHHEQRNVGALEKFDRLRLTQLFGSQEDVFDFTLLDPGQALADLRHRLRGVHGDRIGGVLVGDGIHLVFLQRDQGRYDDGRARDEQAGDLVDRGLSGSRRLHDQGVCVRQE